MKFANIVFKRRLVIRLMVLAVMMFSLTLAPPAQGDPGGDHTYVCGSYECSVYENGRCTTVTRCCVCQTHGCYYCEHQTVYLLIA